MKNIVSLADLSGDEIHSIIELGIRIKRNPDNYVSNCMHKGLLMLFQKTSTRTALSFASAIHQLGGYAVTMDWDKSNFAISPIRYESRYVSRNCDVIMARLKRYQDFLELDYYSSVPVINGCCEKYHPCQALADLMTIFEIKGTFDGVTLTYVGVLNNVANSLMEGCMRVGMKLNLVTPMVNEPSWDQALMDEAYQSGLINQFDSIEQAIDTTDFIYTDTWVDMEFFHNAEYADERDRRMNIMTPYQINRQTLGGHVPYIMHDMPIHPGYEIAEELVECEQSMIYTQAENRMHAQKALLVHLLA